MTNEEVVPPGYLEMEFADGTRAFVRTDEGQPTEDDLSELALLEALWSL